MKRLVILFAIFCLISNLIIKVYADDDDYYKYHKYHHYGHYGRYDDDDDDDYYKYHKYHHYGHYGRYDDDDDDDYYKYYRHNRKYRNRDLTRRIINATRAFLW